MGEGWNTGGPLPIDWETRVIWDNPYGGDSSPVSPPKAQSPTLSRKTPPKASGGANLGISEKAWQAQVVEFAKLAGWMVYHTYDSRRSEPGFPDLVLVRGRRLIFAELKTDTGHPSERQEAWLVALTDAEQHVYIWRPRMWDVIQEVLQ